MFSAEPLSLPASSSVPALSLLGDGDRYHLQTLWPAGSQENIAQVKIWTQIGPKLRVWLAPFQSLWPLSPQLPSSPGLGDGESSQSLSSLGYQSSSGLGQERPEVVHHLAAVHCPSKKEWGKGSAWFLHSSSQSHHNWPLCRQSPQRAGTGMAAEATMAGMGPCARK